MGRLQVLYCSVCLLAQFASKAVGVMGRLPAVEGARGARMSAYVSIRQHTYEGARGARMSAYVSIRQHTPAYVSIRTKALEALVC